MLVVLGIVKNDDKLLLIRRSTPPFDGLLALPGGKVESGEHLDQAICREIYEETYLSVDEPTYLGVFSEEFHDFDMNAVAHHYLHLFAFNVSTRKQRLAENAGWFNIEQHINLVPSDRLIIENSNLESPPFYSRCRTSKRNGQYSARCLDQ